jgi:plasmid replication initiation protein
MLVKIYLQVNLAIKKLIKRKYRNVLSRWVSEIRYIDAEATVKLIFAPAIVPLITKLEEQFTKYELQQVSNLSSAYAVRYMNY